MHAYLLSHGAACTPREVHSVLNGIDTIRTWIAPFPYAAVVICTDTVHALTTKIRAHLPDMWFLLAELDRTNTQGWLPANLWDFVNAPERAELPGVPDPHANPTQDQAKG